MKKSYVHILPVEENQRYASFYLYLPANDNDTDEFYIQYRFIYEINPFNPKLTYATGSNNPSNREFYRIKEAYIVRKEADTFTKMFRALQEGEIGFALREEGAGDYVGGYHGDELLLDARLCVDGKEVALNKEFFGAFDNLAFYEKSEVYRCNTPEDRLILHTQQYVVEDDTLYLKQNIEWVADAKPIQEAYTPMLTAQRLNPAKTEEILTDTVEFFGPEGELLACFDTTPYGADGDGRYGVSVCENTPATSVKVYGKTSGFQAEAGYVVREESIPRKQISTHLCIRYMSGVLDNKIYFNIGCGTSPKAGTVWKSDIFYRITYTPIEK